MMLETPCHPDRSKGLRCKAEREARRETYFLYVAASRERDNAADGPFSAVC